MGFRRAHERRTHAIGDVKQPRCHHDDTAVTADDGAVTLRWHCGDTTVTLRCDLVTVFGDIFFRYLNKKKASSDFGDKNLNRKEPSSSQLENFGLGDGAVTVR